MQPLTEHEIQPGLIVFLIEDKLRAKSDCESNSSDPDYDATGNHSFVVFDKDDSARVAFAFPLLTNATDGKNRYRLNNALKRHHIGGSENHPSHIYKYQTWFIPYDTLIEASSDENTDEDERRTYAENEPDEIDKLRDFNRRNNNPRHPIGPRDQ